MSNRRRNAVLVFFGVGVVASGLSPMIWQARNFPELEQPAMDPSFEAELACRVIDECGPHGGSIEVTDAAVVSDQPFAPGYLACARSQLLPTYANAGHIDLSACASLN